ncbi:MAG: cation:proton antiporter, partial [Pseudomonadota bacterium]
MAGGDAAFLQSAAVFLGAAVVAVPLFKRLKLGSVLGYLAAGIVIGPHTFGLVPEAEQALEVANFGVVLLLFVIGLELRPEKLWRLRGEVFGLGAAQVILTAVLIGVCAYGFSAGYGMTVSEAVVVGAGLALSSTAFAIQILRERGALASRYGDRAFAILLFQDLAIVPLIGLVALLSPGLGDSGE